MKSHLKKKQERCHQLTKHHSYHGHQRQRIDERFPRVDSETLGLQDRSIHVILLLFYQSDRYLDPFCHDDFFSILKSSPHLIEARERIKLNGQSISYKMFSEHFDKCYEELVINKVSDQIDKDSFDLFDFIFLCFFLKKKNAEDEYDIPTYFQILTLMMFRLFREQHIDVAIVEVGIGGEFDYTNIIE